MIPFLYDTLIGYHVGVDWHSCRVQDSGSKSSSLTTASIHYGINIKP